LGVQTPLQPSHPPGKAIAEYEYPLAEYVLDSAWSR
jgi:hypothetical protein